MKPEMKKLIIANLPYLLFVYGLYRFALLLSVQDGKYQQGRIYRPLKKRGDFLWLM